MNDPQPTSHRPPVALLALMAAALVAVASTLAACGGSSKPGTPAADAQDGGAGRGGTLTVGLTSATLPLTDTVNSGGGFEGTRWLSWQLYDGLTRYDLSRGDAVPKIVPALAEKWTRNASGTQWTFTLRQGVAFTDGTPLDADAVIFNFDRYLKPKSKYFDQTLNGVASSYAGQIKSYKKVDDRTIQITSAEPAGHLLEDLPHLVFGSPSAIRKLGNRGFAEHPVGTGPFSLQSKGAQQLVLLANRDYWRGAPKLDRLVLRAIEDPAARVAALRAGQVNLIEYANPDDIPQLKGAGLQIASNNYDHLWFWVLDEHSKGWSDARVRQAANYAIDREAIAKDLLNGSADPAYQAAPRGTPAYDAANDVYRHDPAKAKALLAQAGYADGFDTTITVGLGGAGNLLPVPIAERLQQDLGKVGIRVHIKTLEFGALLGYWAKGKMPPGADGLGAGTTLFTPEGLTPFFTTSDSPWNAGHYGNEEVDRLIRSAGRAFDPEAKAKAYRDAMGQITRDAPWLFVVNDRNPRALSPKVHGFVDPQSWFLDLTKVWVG